MNDPSNAGLRRTNCSPSPIDRPARTMKDGKVVWGKLLNLDTFYVQIFDSTEKLANVSRADVREMTMA